MTNQIRTADFLPEIFKTDVTRQFLNSTLDQLTQQPNTMPIEGYIGSKFGYGVNAADKYIKEYEPSRDNYQLEPSVIFKKDGTSAARDFIDYPSIINALKSNGSTVTNHNTLFSNEFYSWDSFTDLDKLVNFSQYHWLPYGPESVTVTTGSLDTKIDYSVSPTSAGAAVTVDGAAIEALNPTLTLVRGGTYTFNVGPDSEFWIQGTTNLDGNDANLDMREVLGVTNNGATDNIVTFNVPQSDAQNYLDYPFFSEVDLATDYSFNELNNKSVLSIGGEIDGISELDGKTIIFRDEEPSYTNSIYKIKIVDNPINPTLPLINLSVVASIPSLKLLNISSGDKYHSRSLVRNTDGYFSVIPYLSANVPTLYYVDNNNPSCIGTINIVDNLVTDILNIETEVIGKLNFTSKNNVVFTNGLKVAFSGEVYPEFYKNNEYYVEGVGKSIKLIDTKSLTVVEGFARGGYTPFDTQAYDVESFDSTFTIAGTKDYITISRESSDVNAWSRSNRWFHISVLEATAKYNNTNSSLVTLNDQSSKAVRPIIEFYPNLQLFNSGKTGRGTIDFILTKSTLSLLNVKDISITRVDSGNNTLTVGSNSTLTIGALLMLKNTDIGGMYVGKKYYIVSKVGVDKITVTDRVGGPIIPLTDWMGSPGEVVAAESGVLAYGDQIDARAMISGTTKCYFDINLTNPLDESRLVFDGLRLIFADGIDVNDRSSIMELRISKVNTESKIITLSVDSVLSANDQVVVKSGSIHEGLTLWNNGGSWTIAQQKTLINQSPLFDIYDANGISFSAYNSSTFNGSTLFEYTKGSGPDDIILGFPVQYSNVATIGDLDFTVTYQTDSFTYDNSVSLPLINGTVYNGISKLNGWKKAVDPSFQYQIYTFPSNAVVNSEYKCDIPAKSDTKWKAVQVYVDNARLSDSEFAYRVNDKNTTVTIYSGSAIDAKVQILVYSDQVSSNAYYSIPSNLSNNPFNTALSVLSTSDIRAHYKSICNNNTSIIGDPFGSNNYRDAGETVSYGTRLIQHSAPLTYTGAMLRGADNFYSSLEFNSTEYFKFKTTLLDIISTSEFTRLHSFNEMLEYALEEISAVKSEASPFFWSDMLPSKTPVSSKLYTVKNFVGTSIFPLSKVYDLTSANYNGVLVTVRKIVNGNSVDTLLIKNVDYIVSQTKPSVTVSRDLVKGDMIIIDEYDQTYGSYVPNTPTKLGMYPSFVPSVVYDNTYVTPSYFIVGHDGSRSKLFGDYSNGQFTDIRDGVLLEFEKRIYNNLKNSNSSTLTRGDIVPGKFRDNGLKESDYIDMYSHGFMNWAGKNRIDFKTQYYSVTNKFTWNYNKTISELDNSVLSQGSWRGLNLWYYDTVNPAKTPWEMIGYTAQPSWWAARYGAAPYTSNNEILWSDMETGYDWNGGNPRILQQYSRPNLSKIIPVDANGALLSPDALLVATYSSSHQFNKDWNIGDVGPAEFAYLNSSQWPFDLMRIYSLSKPAKFFGLYIDTDQYKNNALLEQYVINKATRSATINHGLYGTGISQHSYVNWMTDYYQHLGMIGNNIMSNLFNSLDVRLVYKLAGFSDKDMLKFYVEKNSSNSKSKSLLIPDENYAIMLYDNVPFDTVVYSSIIVQKTESGFSVWGNSQTKSYFTAYAPKITGQFRTISNVGIEVNLSLTHGENTISIPYGTEFTSIQSLCEFIQNYGRYLESRGMIFDSIDNGNTVNWDRMITEVLYWVKSGWDIGSSINLNPCATQLKINRENSVVQPLTMGRSNYALNQNLTPIKVGDIRVSRNGSEFIMSTLNEGDSFAFCTLNLHSIEHAVVFDNYTQFNDVVYNTTTGLRQQRLIAKGIKTAEWTGILDTNGFILNQDNIEEWSTTQKYPIGSMVKYKNSYWISKILNYPSLVFVENAWEKTDYEKIQKGLLPNASTRSYESSLFYDTNRANLESDNNLLGFSLIGFRPRQYLNDADLTDVSQVNVFKEMLPQKGTRLATSTFKNTNLLRGEIDYVIHENWAIKNSEFGNVLDNNYIEFNLNRSDMTGNPTTIAMYDGSDIPSTDYIIPVSNLTNYGYPISNKNIIPSLNSFNVQHEMSAGYVNFDDVRSYAYSFDGLNDSIVKPSDINGGDSLWIADINGTWNVYTPISIGVLNDSAETTLSSIFNNFDGKSTLVFNNKHGLEVNDGILITNFSPSVDGFYKVTNYIDPFSLSINIDIGNVKSLSGRGVVFKLCTRRIETEDDFKTLQNIGDLDLVWVDQAASGNWAVYDKRSQFTNSESFDIISNTISISDQMGHFITNSEDGIVNRYVRDKRTNSLVLIETVNGPAGFGASLAHDDSDVVIVSAPSGVNAALNVYRVVNNNQFNTMTLNQSIAAMDNATVWGQDVAISNDGDWMYASALSPSFNRVYAFSRQPYDARTSSGYTLSGDISSNSTTFSVIGDRTSVFTSGLRISFSANRDYGVLLSVFNPLSNTTVVSIDANITDIVNIGSIIYINTVNFEFVGYIEIDTPTILDGNPLNISTNRDGSVVVIGVPNKDYNLTNSNTGEVYVYHRLQQKYESTGSAPMSFNLAWVPSSLSQIKVNGIYLHDSEFTVTGNTVTITSDSLIVGDLIQVESSNFVLGQILAPFSSEGDATVGVNFGAGIDISDSGMELIVGAPGSLVTTNRVGAAFRYSDTGKKLGRYSFTPLGLNSATIIINGYAVDLPAGDSSTIAGEISRNNIPNINAAVLNGSVVLTLRDIPKNDLPKLSVIGASAVDNIELGLTNYSLIQLISPTTRDDVTDFGKKVLFNSDNSVLISAPKINGYLNSAFEVGTIFDNNGTKFFDFSINAGAVYMFDCLPSESGYGLFIEGQYFTSYNTNNFGTSIGFSTNEIAISNSNTVLIYDSATKQRNWSVKRYETSIADIKNIKSAILYDTVSNTTLENLDFFDPLQGKLLSAVQDNLDIMSSADPAGYNSLNSFSEFIWADEQVGSMWFDTSKVKFINNYQNDLQYVSSNWGKPFNGSDVAVYTWVASNVIPSEYTGAGTPRSVDNYSSSFTVTSDNRIVEEYYFWVRNSNTIYSDKGKTLSDSTLERYITDPQSSGISYMAVYSPSVFGLYNASEYINGNDTAMHLRFSNGGNGEQNSEFTLIRTDFDEDFLEGVPAKVSSYIQPYGLYEHYLNSLSGTDRFGNAIPDPQLPIRVRYGISVNPRQSMFVDNRMALKNLIDYANSVMLAYPITETRRPSLLFTGNSQDYWSRVNWWESGFNESTKAAVEVERFYDLLKLVPKEKMIAAVSANSDGQREIYQYTGGTWVRIGLISGTIMINPNIYTYAGFGTDLSDTTFDSFPAQEIKNIVRSLMEEIFIDDLIIHRNKSLIMMFEYIQSESLATQNYMTWLSKTSFIDISHKVGKLTTSPKYKGDSQTLLEGFLTEVTPYHVVFKDFLFTYSNEEVYASNSTDFDIPALYQSDTGRFVSPQMIYKGENNTNDDQYYSTDPIWNNPSFSEWANNYGIKLGGLSNHYCANSIEYISAKSASIKVDNVSGFPSNGLLKLDDEYMYYSGTDVINNVILNVTRGVNGSQIVPHYPTQIYITTNGVVLLHGGRAYNNAPKITAKYRDGDYHPLPTTQSIFKSNLIGDSVGAISVIVEGSGYSTQPIIDIEPAFIVSFISDNVNTGNNTIVVTTTTPLETYDTVTYKASPTNSIIGLIPNQYYFVRVFSTIENNGVYTQQISLYSEYHYVHNNVHPVELLSRGGNIQMLAQGAIAYAVGSTSPVRQNITTLRFDRTSYTPSVTTWKSGSFYAGDVQENNMFASSGVLMYDTKIFGNLAPNGGSGNGAVFTVNHLRTGSKYLADYEVTFTNTGTGYRVGDIMVVQGSNFGGISTHNDLTISVTDINVIDPVNVSGSILKYDVLGIAPFDYTLAEESNVYTGLFPINDTGTGAGAVVDVVTRSKVVPPSNTYSLDTSYTGGEGYVIGDNLIISGVLLGGISPDNDATITVTNVINVGTIAGVIESATVEGSGFIDIRASSQFGVLPITGVSTSNGTANLILNYAQSGLHPSQLNGQRISLHGTPRTYNNVAHVTTIGGGSGARFTVTTPKFSGDSVTAEYSVNLTQLGSILAVGSGYRTGDVVRIDGSLLGGVSPANDAYVVIEYVDGVMGRIEEVSVYGRAAIDVEQYYAKTINETTVELYGNSTLTKKVINSPFNSGDFGYIPKLENYSASLVVFDDAVYKCNISNHDTIFDFSKWTQLKSDDRSLNALDRISAYYAPTGTMPAKDISSLVKGVTYPNAVYKGNNFNSDLELDTILQNLPFIAEIEINAVVKYNNVTYAIGETKNSTLLLKYNGGSWESNLIANEPINCTDLAIVNGLFILTASSVICPLMTSNDGLTWTASGKESGYDISGYDVDEFDDSNINVSSTYINSLLKNTNKFLAGGNNISSSIDGVHWNKVFSFVDSDVNNLPNSINDLEYGDISQFIGYIGVGEGDTYRQDLNTGEYSLVHIPRIAVSVDGDVWEELIPSGIPDVGLTSVVIGHDRIIATANNSMIYSSFNGLVWSEVGTSGNVINDSIFANGKFILVGENATVVISDDGITWTSINLNLVTSDSLNAITWETEFLAVGENSAIITSIDGVSWNNISEVNQKEVDYTVIGDAFESGYAPEEMVAGVISDSVSIRVSTVPGGDWDGMQSVYFNNGFKITRSSFKLNEDLQVNYSNDSSNPATVAVFVYNTITGLGRRIYQIPSSSLNEIVIANHDWVKSIITLNAALQFDEILVVETYEVGGGNILMKSSSKELPLLSDPNSGNSVMPIPFKSIDFIELLHPVFINGLEQNYGSDYTVVGVPSGNIEVRFTRVLDPLIDYVSVALMGKPTPEMMIVNSSGEFTQIFDLIDPLTTYMNTNSGEVTVKSIVTGDWTLVSPLNWSTDGTKIIINDELLLQNTQIKISLIDFGVPSKYMSTFNGGDIILPSSIGIFASVDSLLVKVNDVEITNFTVDITNNKLIIPSIAIGDVVAVWLKTYSLVEDYIFSPPIGTTTLSINEPIGQNNIDSSIVAKNGIRLNYSADYTFANSVLTLVVPTVLNDIISITTYDNTRNQYMLTQSITNKIIAEVQQIDNSIPAVLTVTDIINGHGVTVGVTKEMYISSDIIGAYSNKKFKCKAISSTKLELYELDGTSVDGSIYAYTSGSYISEVSNFKINQSFEITNMDRVWVTKNGLRVMPERLSVIDTNNLVMSIPVIPTDIIVITTMTPSHSPDQLTYCITIDKHSNATVHRRGTHAAWLTQPLLQDSTNIKVDDVNKLLHNETQYASAELFNNQLVARISGDRRSVCAVKVYNESSKAEIPSSNFRLALDNLSPIIIFSDNSVNHNDKLRLTVSNGDTVCVDGEYIRFNSVDYVNNSVGGLTRGAKGSAINPLHDIYANVYSVSLKDQLPQYYYGINWNSEDINVSDFNTGVTLGDPLQVSSTYAAKFLKLA